MKTMLINGIDVSYTEEDNNRKKILFIHGYESSHNFIRELHPEERDYDIIAIDLPGYGKSEYEGFVSVEFYATVLRLFIKKLNLKNLTIVAHSMGGAIAMFISDMKQINKIVLVNSLNPYVLSTARKHYTLSDFMLRVKSHNSKKSIGKKFDDFKIYAHNYIKLNRKIVRQEFFNEQWLGNNLYRNYLKGAPKAYIISSENDPIVLPASMQQTSSNFKIPLWVMKNALHSPINKDPKQFNKILQEIIQL